MKYLFYYKGSRNPKNKADIFAYVFLKTFDRQLFSKVYVKDAQSIMLDKIKLINAENPRCTPVILKFNEDLASGDISLFVGDGDTTSFQATFLKVRED